MNILKRIIPAIFLACTLCGCADKPVPKPSPTVSATVATQPSTLPPETTLPTETTPPEPDTVSILDFLRIAVQPVGQTMYIWGGGWNEADTGAGMEAVTLGVSPQWAVFAASQNSSYNYKDHRYQIHDGLDCSGYVGWAVYNALETENGRPGYVTASTQMAQHFAQRGLGRYIPAADMERWLPGDIISMKGHVWITVGMCPDGSVLLLHSSPPGVMFSGTTLPDGSDSQASLLAQRIMAEHYPDWHSRYPQTARPHTYLVGSNAMRWNTDILSDKEGLLQMDAEEIVQILFQ